MSCSYLYLLAIGLPCNGLPSDNFSQSEGERLALGSRPATSTFNLELANLLVIIWVMRKSQQQLKSK